MCVDHLNEENKFFVMNSAVRSSGKNYTEYFYQNTKKSSQINNHSYH